MRYYLRLQDYTNLDSVRDLKPEVVKEKLEMIICSMPATVRQQLDRCFSLAFCEALESIAVLEAAKSDKIGYFTEDSQPLEFHKLAYLIFCYIFSYGGAIGQLIRETITDKEAKSIKTIEIAGVARRVFHYADCSKPIPEKGREEMREFREWLSQLRQRTNGGS